MKWQHAACSVAGNGQQRLLMGVLLPWYVCTGVLVGISIPVGIPEGIPFSLSILGAMDIPISTGILAWAAISIAAFALPELQPQHPQCRVGHRGMKAPPTGCMSKAPSSAKMLLKTLPSREAPGLTAVQIPLMITVTF